ncbi:MAG: hypothetical protein ABR530_09195 [Pyrinomonadaceae bacterium]
MARPLILSLDGQEFPVSIVKIDREKLYGRVEIEAFDEKGREASLKILAADGKTLIDKGGTSLATLNINGDSVDRNELLPVDSEGKPIEQVPSSFNGPNVLKRTTVEDYLLQIVKSVYLLKPFGEADLGFLYDHLSSDQIFTFPFSYRGGVEYDNAFVIGSAGDGFMVTSKLAQFQFIKLNQAVPLGSNEEGEISADDIDFDLL